MDRGVDEYVLGCGLAYGSFRTKGFLVSAEKASRTDSICFCMSAIGHAFIHVSRILMCRVKYSRASAFRSGSGDVTATCVPISDLHDVSEKGETHQV